MQKPLVSIIAHSQKKESLAGYSVISRWPNPLNAFTGFAESDMTASFRAASPLNLVVTNGFDKPDRNPILCPLGGRSDNPFRFLSMGNISANMVLDAANALSSFRESIGRFNDLIAEFAHKNGVCMDADQSWGASLAGAELTDDSITFFRLGNALTIIETDWVMINLESGDYHYLDGDFEAVARIEWDPYQLNEVKRAAFFVSQAPIATNASKWPKPDTEEQFIGGITDAWKFRGPQKAIDYVLEQQLFTRSDYAAIILDLTNKR